MEQLSAQLFKQSARQTRGRPAGPTSLLKSNHGHVCSKLDWDLNADAQCVRSLWGASISDGFVAVITFGVDVGMWGRGGRGEFMKLRC